MMFSFKNYWGHVFLLGVVLLCTKVFSESVTLEKAESGNNYTASTKFKEFIYNSEKDSLAGYTLSVSAPSGFSFVDEKTVASAGSLNVSNASDGNKESTNNSGVKKLTMDSASSATAYIAADTEPYSFTLSMSGELTKPGDNPGSNPSWSATGESNFFWLTPFIEKVIRAGTSITISAHGSDDKVNWEINSRRVSCCDGKDSLGFGPTLWDTMKWSVPAATNPPADRYFISAFAQDGSNRSSYTRIDAVEITCPAPDGRASKWNQTAARYDCQAVASSAQRKYDLPIKGNWASRSDGNWSLSDEKGSITSASSSETTFSPSDQTGSTELELKFDITKNEILDRRTITVFQDHLERDYYNFGTSRSSMAGWKPLGRYGVDEKDLPAMKDWNCFGSARHAYDGEGSGYSSWGGSGLSSLKTRQNQSYTKETGQTFSASQITIPLQRGDIIAYELQGEIVHVQTVLNPATKSTYGANNANFYIDPVNPKQDWKWYVAPIGDYLNLDYKNFYFKIYIYR